MWTVDRTKKPPAVLTNAWQDSGRPSSLFECLGVRVSCVSWNPQIRRICISGTLFLFYALWFFQYAVIVSDYSCFSALCAKIPHFSAGFLSASFLSMQVGLRRQNRFFFESFAAQRFRKKGWCRRGKSNHFVVCRYWLLSVLYGSILRAWLIVSNSSLLVCSSNSVLTRQ